MELISKVRRNTTSSHFGVGARVGDYQIERELRREITGAIYAVKHQLLPRRAALKVMHHHPGGLRGMAVQVLREACVLESLDRAPYIPRVYETGMLADRRPWYAFEDIVGPTLAQRAVDGPLPAAELVEMMRDVAATLVRVHEFGAIHGRIIEDAIVQGPSGHHHLIEWSEVATLDSDFPADPAIDVFALGKIALRAMENAPHLGGTRSAMPADLLLLIDAMLDIPDDRPPIDEVHARLLALEIPVDPRTRRWTPYAGNAPRARPEPDRTVRPPRS